MKLSEALCKKSEMLNVRDVIKVSDGPLASDQIKKVMSQTFQNYRELTKISQVKKVTDFHVSFMII